MPKADDRTIPIRPQLESNVVKFPVGNSCKPRARKPPTSENADDASREFVLSVLREEMEFGAAEEGAQPPTSASITAENGRLRQDRRKVWRMAEAATRYWRTRLKFTHAVAFAQRMEIPEGSFHPYVGPTCHIPMVDSWRAALVRQLLTPAWDVASVKWKQMALAKGEHRFADVKPERIERAIADDLAFLAAHPVRRSNSEAMALNREFKEAMRQRIREVAAARNLSDEEIKPAMSLKHYKLVKFVEEHGINWEWLLEGRGRIFENDPIRLNPNMTGNEFAAVVATLPPADQRAITAVARGMLTLQKGDQ